MELTTGLGRDFSFPLELEEEFESDDLWIAFLGDAVASSGLGDLS